VRAQAVLLNLKGEGFPVFVNEEEVSAERVLQPGDVVSFLRVNGDYLHFRWEAPLAQAEDATVAVRRACVRSSRTWRAFGRA
jgi:hypothetical protein